jgi:hypothetical protein
MKREHGDAESGPEDATAPRPSEPNEEHADQQPSANDFHPIRIKGEPLSAVIIRERRERPY